MDLAAQAGLYLHVPFCQQKCPYCSFASHPPQGGEIAHYLAAIQQQMEQLAANPEIQALTFATLFFGGGTPSMLGASELARLLTSLRALFPLSGDEPEISIEVNPGTIDARGLEELRQAGFNRLSIGVQSLDDAELRLLGRIHTSAEALETLAAARRAGFDNASLDLMYGLPGQSPASWRTTLHRALDTAPAHLSLYELTLEEGTPLHQQVGQGALNLPPEDEILAMMDTIQASLGPLTRYEISNYALPGRECRHNLNYWHNGLYLGLGPGAVSAFGGGRRAAVTDLADFGQRMAQGLPAWEEVEELTPEAAFRETVIMGLRLIGGVSLDELSQRFAIDLPAYYGPLLDRLLGQDLLTFTDDRLFLTPKGLPLANQVMAQLV